MSHILIVEDDTRTAKLLHLYLQQAGHRTSIASTGRQALNMVRRTHMDLILLDLMLPEMDGLDLCSRLHNETATPIIILTARTTEEDVLRGLDVGADDYITKPFSPREVVARVRTVLRRARMYDDDENEVLHLGDLTINLQQHRVMRGETLLHLTPKEFRLLETMAREPGRVFSRLELVERAFGYDYEGLERTVDAHVMNLRKKIEVDHNKPVYVETVYGFGYRFTEPKHV